MSGVQVQSANRTWSSCSRSGVRDGPGRLRPAGRGHRHLAAGQHGGGAGLPADDVGHRGGALVQRPGGVGRGEGAGQGGRRGGQQSGGQGRGHLLVLLVGLGEPGPLDGLGDLGEPAGLPAGDLEQPVQELPGRVDRVLHLLLGAPPLRGPLLEQPEGVAVAVVQVAQSGLLLRGGQRDDRGPLGQPAGPGDGGDGGRVRGLLLGQGEGRAGDGAATGHRGHALAVGVPGQPHHGDHDHQQRRPQTGHPARAPPPAPRRRPGAGPGSGAGPRRGGTGRRPCAGHRTQGRWRRAGDLPGHGRPWLPCAP